MLKIEHIPQTVNPSANLICCFDVGKDALEGYALHLCQGASDRQITLSIERKTDQIEEPLNALYDYADRQGLKGLCVVCEPTGGYDQELLRLARLNGHRAAYTKYHPPSPGGVSWNMMSSSISRTSCGAN